MPVRNAPGVETCLPVMVSQAQAGRWSLADVSPWLSQRPAELYGLVGKADCRGGGMEES